MVFSLGVSQDTDRDASFGDRELMKLKRVLLVASAGGHWVQLCRLSEAFVDMDAQFVTTMRGARAPIGDRTVLSVRDASRNTPVLMLLLLIQIAWILVRFRPTAIVTTGAAPGLLALRLGKFVGAKTIWIDSIANSEELSLSGRLAGPHVDLWLTQWPHLVGDYPGLRHFGAVL